MDWMNEENEAAFRSVLNDFAQAYNTRDTSLEFTDWLADRFGQEMRDLSAEDCRRLAHDMVGAIARYDENLNELKAAKAEGRSSAEWLAERSVEAFADRPVQEIGEQLGNFADALYTGNAQMLLLDPAEAQAEYAEGEVAETADWNEYSVKDVALNIGKQALVAGAGAAAELARQFADGTAQGESPEIGGAVKDALIAGAVAAGDVAVKEVKAVVAGAIKTAAERNLTDMLPPGTSTEIISDIACVSVDNAKTMYAVAKGDLTIAEGIEQIADATVVTTADAVAAIAVESAAEKAGLAGRKLGRKLGAMIPYIGPTIGSHMGAWLGEMAGTKIGEVLRTHAAEIRAVAVKVAVTAWNDIKQTGRQALTGIKEKLFGQKSQAVI
jgi:hypothetical protein